MTRHPRFPLALTTAAVLFAAGVAQATTVFDSTSVFVNANNTQVGPSGGGSMGGTDISLSLSSNPFMPNDPPAYLGNFGTVDFSPAGGSNLFATSEENNGVVEVTAKALDGNTGDATVRAAVAEINPAQPDDNNPGGTIVLKEIYLYDFTAGDFSDSEFTTLQRDVQQFSQMTLLVDVFDDMGGTVGTNFFGGVFFPNDGSGFVPNFDTVPIYQTGFQTPTSDGVDDGANTGPVILEVQSIELRVPEPASLLTLSIGAMGLLVVQRRKG